MGPVEGALVAFADSLTRNPADRPAARVDTLRAVGLDDATILFATQVVAYFNFVSRIAAGLGVETDPFDVPGA
jgi:alkylhydroperoxidase family enzyme